MAFREFWIGTVGPLYYDDAVLYDADVGDLVYNHMQVGLAAPSILVTQMRVEDLTDIDGITVLKLLTTTGGVNYFTMKSAIAGASPILSVDGVDSQIGIRITTKNGGANPLAVSIAYDGKITLIEDLNTAAGKRYLVNGAQHQHVSADVTDLAATIAAAIAAEVSSSVLEKFVCFNNDFVFFNGAPVHTL
jgi:hypothetical protein